MSPFPSDAFTHDRPPAGMPELPFRVPAIWECWAVAFGAGVAVFALTTAVQWLVYSYWLEQNEFHMVGVSVASLLTFALIQRIMAASRERRIATLHRFEIIREMNHHIRNSLQTILYQSYSMDDESAARIKDAAERIQWVLERVLPEVDDSGKWRTPPDPDDSSKRAA